MVLFCLCRRRASLSCFAHIRGGPAFVRFKHQEHTSSPATAVLAPLHAKCKLCYAFFYIGPAAASLNRMMPRTVTVTFLGVVLAAEVERSGTQPLLEGIPVWSRC